MPEVVEMSLFTALRGSSTSAWRRSIPAVSSLYSWRIPAFIITGLTYETHTLGVHWPRWTRTVPDPLSGDSGGEFVGFEIAADQTCWNGGLERSGTAFDALCRMRGLR